MLMHIQDLDELKDIHSLPSVLLFSDGSLVHTVQGISRLAQVTANLAHTR